MIGIDLVRHRGTDHSKQSGGDAGTRPAELVRPLLENQYGRHDEFASADAFLLSEPIRYAMGQMTSADGRLIRSF